MGVGLYLRTGPQVTRLEEQLQSAPSEFFEGEAARMPRVQRNFIVIKYVELVVIIVAAIVAISSKSRPGVAGVALGLLISASVLLAFDWFAERRGEEYVTALDAGPRVLHR